MDFDQTIGKSFDIDFCQRLGFHLTGAFYNNCTNKFERIWCDGVLEPEKWRQDIDELAITKEIVTTGWLGLDGQDKHWIIIKLGPLSFEKCLKGQSLRQCLPSDQSLDWVSIDATDKIVTLQLL